jgi:hypothetical protein
MTDSIEYCSACGRILPLVGGRVRLLFGDEWKIVCARCARLESQMIPMETPEMAAWRHEREKKNFPSKGCIGASDADD